MQAAGNFVAVGIELAAGMQLGHDDFGRRYAFVVHVHRNAAPVVDHRDGVVDVNRYVDLGAVAGQRLVDGVIDHFVDQMMQARFTGGPDIHGRSQADGLEPFQNFDG